MAWLDTFAAGEPEALDELVLSTILTNRTAALFELRLSVLAEPSTTRERMERLIEENVWSRWRSSRPASERHTQRVGSNR